MKLYGEFIHALLRNYLIGSTAAVLGLGGFILFTTVRLPMNQLWLLGGILTCSLLVMLWTESLVFRRDIRPIHAVFATPRPSRAVLEHAFHTTHRLPFRAVRRILGPHLFGLSIPAVILTYLAIRFHLVNIPYDYILFAGLGAVFVACMHALIEFFLTTRAITPILKYVLEVSALEQHPLRTDGKVLITIARKFQISAFLISSLPLFLFTVAAGVRFTSVSLTEKASNGYWMWALSIVVVCVIFSFVSALLLARDVQAPISYMYALFDQVREGDLTVNALDLYSDEFSHLIAGFNHMVAGLREREQRSTTLLESYFATLAAALDARDQYTAGHSKRVAEYSVDIAAAAGWTGQMIDTLRRSALLHDIGKIGVPDSILLWDGKLSDEQFERMKGHPVMGENILMQVEPKDALGPLLPGVRSHHERFDGGGYPDGLAGRKIPVLGRVIAVADAFDAMTSDRPYRKGMPVERAMAILESGKGTQWDPEFVELFLTTRAVAATTEH